MDIQELLNKINKSIEDLDLVTARKHIEGNIVLLNEYKHLLRGNARALLDFLTNNTDKKFIDLNRQEMNVVYGINTYASNFDLRGLKLSVKNNAALLMREEVKSHLNEDAKTLLEGMSTI
ncbi:hypothetical protein [Sporosarcina sp. FSL K6-3457]|uniref:hypothetical protein n=1 Tax=Sporosarcina sp. FSL K6-3457 TaxID=2978204 RepID=UPI0030F4E74F